MMPTVYFQSRAHHKSNRPWGHSRGGGISGNTLHMKIFLLLSSFPIHIHTSPQEGHGRGVGTITRCTCIYSKGKRIDANKQKGHFRGRGYFHGRGNVSGGPFLTPAFIMTRVQRTRARVGPLPPFPPAPRPVAALLPSPRGCVGQAPSQGCPPPNPSNPPTPKGNGNEGGPYASKSPILEAVKHFFPAQLSEAKFINILQRCFSHPCNSPVIGPGPSAVDPEKNPDTDARPTVLPRHRRGVPGRPILGRRANPAAPPPLDPSGRLTS